MGVSLRKRRLPSGKVQVYFDIYGFGKRSTESFGILPGDRFNNKEMLRQAEAARAQRELDERARKHNIPTFRQQEAEFIDYMRKYADSKTAPHTIAGYLDTMNHFAEFAGANITFADITRKKLEEWRADLLKKMSPNSVHVYFARLNTVLRQAIIDGIIPTNPAFGIRIKRQEGLPVHYSIKELRALAKTMCHNEQVKAAFLFSCFSGLRYSDVNALTWDRVKDGYIEFSQKKTGTPERLPLSEQALKILRTQKKAKRNPLLKSEKPENVVFFLPVHSVIGKHLKKWAKAAKIGKPISFHKARHTFATLSLSSGNDLYTTSKLLGHKNLQTTQIYAKVIDKKKQQAINKLPRI